MKKVIVVLFLSVSVLYGQTEFSGIGGKAGAFSRMGFGARGMGMGNAMSAVIWGNLVSYYNPALAAFQQGDFFSAGYSPLSLDRSLNFLNFTRKFEMKDRKNSSGRKSTAGLSVGIINAGVSNIDERDNQGTKTGTISTSENQIFVGLSKKMSKKLSVGIAVKFYYYKLYKSITSNALGFDIGAVYLVNNNLTVSLMISDINSKYKWNTTKLYGQQGLNTVDEFPLLKKIGFAYNFKKLGLITAVEFENDGANVNFLRFGMEYKIFRTFSIRGGFDKLNLSNFDYPFRPSLGFSYFYAVSSWKIGIDYAYVFEPYSAYDRHVIGIDLNL